jgi:hypothetical protein
MFMTAPSRWGWGRVLIRNRYRRLSKHYFDSAIRIKCSQKPGAQKCGASTTCREHLPPAQASLLSSYQFPNVPQLKSRHKK